MKRSDNLRLVFTVSHMSKGLKSPLPKKAPFRLACKLNFTFHMLGWTTTDNRCRTVSPELMEFGRTGHGEMSSYWRPSHPHVGDQREFGRQSDMSRWQFETNFIARQFLAIPFVWTKGIKCFSFKRLKLTFCI